MPESRKFFEKLIERLDRVGRREVEEYLLAQESRRGLLSSILNSMQEGLLAFDPRGKVVLVNRAAREIFSLGPQEEGSSLEEILPSPVLREMAREGLKMPAQSLVRDIFLPERGSRWIRISRGPLLDGDGVFRGVLMLGSDVTRSRKSEREATLAEKVDFLTYLVAVVAHELGNPLASLSLHLQLMRRQIAKVRGETGRKLSRGAEILTEEMTRLDGIVRQFLQALRPGSLQLREGDLAVLGREVIELLRPELERRGVGAFLAPPPRPAKARYDRDMIKQVLINLVRNSLQASSPGGKIVVSWRVDGGYLEIRVSDRGKGIGPGEVPRVMEPFFTTREGGSGLGLLVVYRIVRQHGGMVEIKSSPGEGTAVTVWIPRRPDDIKRLPGPSEEEG